MNLHSTTRWGIEIEGYTSECIRNESIRNWDFVGDGSLNDSDEECARCDGHGHIHETCNHCNGNGRVECEECEGQGETLEVCEECGGTTGEYNEYGQWIECSHCDDDGYVSVRCDNCNGRGRVQCEDCEGDGSFEVECNHCDGSGRVDSGELHYGVECVSNILQGNASHVVDGLFNHLEGLNWYIDNTCGTHVHVDASRLTTIDLMNLSLFMNAIEPMIYGMSSEGRFIGRYSAPISGEFISDIITKYQEIAELDSIFLQRCQFGSCYYRREIDGNSHFGKYDHARYHGLNMHSVFYRGTVEFRYFDGCKNEEFAKNVAELCVKIVDFIRTTNYEQLFFILTEFSNTNSFDELANKVKQLLDISFDIHMKSESSYLESRQNVAELRPSASITRQVM